MIKGNVPSEVFDPIKFVQYVASFNENTDFYSVNVNASIFPLMSLRKNHFNYLFSLPYSLYSSIKPDDIKAEIIDSITRVKCDVLTINFPPFVIFSNEEAALLASTYNCELSINTCHVVDTKRPIDEIINNFNSTRKKHIKRYQKLGKINVFQTKESYYFEEYYNLYIDSVNRWGIDSIGYSKELIANLNSVPGISMWVAEFENKVISAMICIYHSDHVFDWLAASIINDDVKKLYAPVAVQFEVIRHASELGLKYVNMGASVNLAGVSDFKDSWGASEYETYTFRKQSRLFQASKKIVTHLKKLRSKCL